MNGTFAITDINLWLNFVYFLFAFIITTYIPGSLFLKNLKFDPFSKSVISIVLGMVLWGYQGYIFGYLDFRFGSYIYIGICLLLWIFQNRKVKLKPIKLKKVREYVPLFLLLIIGTFVQLVTTWFSGISIPQGLYFCCGIDSIYHVALTQELVKQFPPYEPGTFRTVVENYHYFSNMIVAEWIRVFGLPLTATYFQFSTVVLSLLMGISAITFGRIAGLKKTYMYWLLLFIYMSGSATYLIILFTRHILDIQSIVLYDATIMWASPPRVYAIVVFFAGLSLLYVWMKKRNTYVGILSGILFGCLISIKVYFGLFVLAGLCVLNLYFLYKRDFKALIPSLVTLLFSLLLYLPVNKESGGLFFVGMWRFENFIVFPPLGLTNLELYRATYASEGNILRVVLIETLFVGLYFIATFGTLLVGFMQSLSSLKLLRKELHYFLIGGIVISLLAGMLFIQDTGGANSSQFIITVIAIMPIYAALAMSYWTYKFKNKIILAAVILIVVILTIPRATHDTIAKIQAISNRADFTLKQEELAALTFLNKAPVGTILGPASDCLYIPLISGKPIYACNDAGVLTDHKVKNGNERTEIAKELYTNINAESTHKKLKSLGITYIYVRKDEMNTNKLPNLPILFQNNKVAIYVSPKK